MFSARVGVGVRVCCLALSSIVFSTTLCSAQSASPASDLIGRWIDPQTFQLLTRYHYVDPATPTPVANQMQTFEQLRFRVKADPAGRVAVGFGYSSGSTFIGSWNDTGIGTGTTRLHVGLRLLWLDVTPVKGVTAQVGSLQIVRGESTEFTTFDNDGYMVGERISVRRPKSFFFDEVSVTRGFLGDANKPSVFDRTERFGDFNYQQYLLARHFATHVWASADLTRWNHVDITHAAVRAQLPPELRLIDGVRYEQYVRAAGGTVGTVAGFTVSGEKKILSPLLVSLGYGDIDKNYGSLNADRFNRGRRLFGIATYTLSPVLALSTFVGRAVHNDYLVSNHTRVDVTLTYNVLAQLQRAGVLH